MSESKYVLHSDERGRQEILAGPVNGEEAERVVKGAVDARMEEIGKTRDVELSISGYGTVITYADGGVHGKELKERYQVTTYTTDIWTPYAHTYRKLSLSMPAVIFLDGCKTTRDHEKYNMLPENSVPYQLSQCAYQVAEKLGLDADIYTALDEISFFFPTPSQLLPALGTDDHAEYVLTLFVREAEKEVQEVYPEMALKGQIFNIRDTDKKLYFSEREEICRECAAMYYAKEYLGKEEYAGKGKEEVEELLKARGLYEGLTANTQLYNGIHTQHRKKTAMDVMAGMLEEATKYPYKKKRN